MTSTQSFACFVRGTPAPKGSKSAFVHKGRAIVTEGRSSKQWESDVRRLLQDRYEGAPMEGAVSVALQFSLLKPPSVARKRQFPTVKPDIDKLARAVLDALTGIVIRDDAQVVRLSASKLYGDEAGVLILVDPHALGFREL